MYGMHVHRAVLAAGERCSGATIHIVTDEYDAGPIVEQMRVPINLSDTPESLMERVRAAEHFLYPRVIERYSRNLLVRRS
jgi:phosphoribosylglycinamide formyltransferase-1